MLVLTMRVTERIVFTGPDGKVITIKLNSNRPRNPIQVSVAINAPDDVVVSREKIEDDGEGRR